MMIRKLALYAAIPIGFAVSVFAANSLAQNDPTADSGVSVKTIAVPKKLNPCAVAVGDGTAWILGAHELIKLGSDGDKFTTIPIEEVKTFSPAGLGDCPGLILSAGGGSIWVLARDDKSPVVRRIDESSGKSIAAIPLDKKKGTYSIAYGEGSLWVINEFDGTLTRIDAATNQISATIALGKGFWAPPAIGDGAVWVIGLETGLIKRVDTQLNQVTDEFSGGRPQKNGILTSVVKGGMYRLSSGASGLWVVSYKYWYGEYTIVRTNPKTHGQMAPLKLENSLGGAVEWRGAVWAAYGHGSGITTVSAETNQVLGRISLPADRGHSGLGDKPPLLMADADALWMFEVGPDKMLVRRIQVK